ncbi:hypothetical protein PLESTB_000977100 [Pleodorina starrii]|uniref:Dirigent protein n=1 Tax=Pleodorina starrii TaxID=330485 RepID=A0A9W6F4H1_9CHLO|nr:hypothetical protein PLESTB_000977100 [Pleodorina starrii]GLC66233.1 hypothetical protein PLESTF_000401900 [Pleodorina starrii]
MDFNTADPYARPDGYMIAFTNFNIVSRVGQVAAQGIWTEKATGSSSFVILGGTGIYTHAAGSIEMRVVDRSVYWFKIKMEQESC